MARAVTITGDQFDDIVPGLKKALDEALAGTLGLQQGALAKACPKDTGRMASSFFVSADRPEYGSRPESWGEPNEQRVEIDEYPPEAISFGGRWYISNNVPYAQYVALNYKPSAKAQKDWYTSVSNQTGVVFAKQFKKVAP
jgi:hypothetical protein